MRKLFETDESEVVEVDPMGDDDLSNQPINDQDD